MKYIELTVHTTTEGSELVADAMWNETEFGVTVCDKNDLLSLISDPAVFWDYLDEDLRQSGGEALVKGYFDAASAEEKIRAVTEEIYARRERGKGAVSFGTLETTRREVEGDDWVEVWKKHFRPHKLGKIVVVPAWISYAPAEGEKTVLLDSDMAFGTGEHETTAMCVLFAQKYLREGDLVYDIGCGSGILGLCALRLGAKEAYLSDLDPVAVRAAERNCERNGLADRAHVLLADLLQAGNGRADLIFANLTAEILYRLAPALPARMNEGGRAILSGILRDRERKVFEVFTAQGLKMLDRTEQGEWVSLVFGR